MKHNKPKLAIVGYGKMGKEIELLAHEKGFAVTNIFDIDNPLSSEQEYDFDVAIEFTTPDSVLENVKTLARLKKNIVIGTTGWYDKISEVKSIVEKEGIGAIYSPNFSVGVNILFSIINEVSKIINNFEEYDILVEEIHHRHKKDYPSGTALKIAEEILRNVSRKKRITTELSPNDCDALRIASLRVGETFGIHKIILDSSFDTIEITHTAKNRKGFALGALIAAQIIHNKKGFFEFSLKNIENGIYPNSV
jgi:4-hydroxy-tetrahydrodipicolinate reductase